MNQYVIKQAVIPLRMIFWGGLLCIVDISFTMEWNDGTGFKFDILNDVLGTILIAVGVFRLRDLPVNSRYAGVMKFVLVVAVLNVLDAIRSMFIMPLPAAIEFILYLIGLATLAAIVAFCFAMRWFCEQAELPEAERSWSITTTLFVVVYLIPLGFLYVVGALAIATGNSFHLDLGPAGLLALPVLALPIIHLFVSTSRMQRSAEAI